MTVQPLLYEDFDFWIWYPLLILILQKSNWRSSIFLWWSIWWRLNHRISFYACLWLINQVICSECFAPRKAHIVHGLPWRQPQARAASQSAWSGRSTWPLCSQTPAAKQSECIENMIGGKSLASQSSYRQGFGAGANWLGPFLPKPELAKNIHLFQLAIIFSRSRSRFQWSWSRSQSFKEIF